MANPKTQISWTDRTWNPVSGCSKVSHGCQFCYAEALSLRFKWSTSPWTAQNAAQNVLLHPERLWQPRAWREPARVFVNSMADLFHELVPSAFIAQVWAVMAQTPHLTYQILTKRPHRMADILSEPTALIMAALEVTGRVQSLSWPLPNVWLGVSVEDQRRADERIPVLLDTRAAVRFVSAEPLLGPVDLSPYFPVPLQPGHEWQDCLCLEIDPADRPCNICSGRAGLGWVIAGGESGPHHRPMDLDWVRAIRDQCAAARVPFFFKQSAGRLPGRGDILDGREHKEFPA